MSLADGGPCEQWARAGLVRRIWGFLVAFASCVSGRIWQAIVTWISIDNRSGSDMWFSAPQPIRSRTSYAVSLCHATDLDKSRQFSRR